LQADRTATALPPSCRQHCDIADVKSTKSFAGIGGRGSATLKNHPSGNNSDVEALSHIEGSGDWATTAAATLRTDHLTTLVIV
jgi:hypothetical protein